MFIIHERILCIGLSCKSIPIVDQRKKNSGGESPVGMGEVPVLCWWSIVCIEGRRGGGLRGSTSSKKRDQLTEAKLARLISDLNSKSNFWGLTSHGKGKWVSFPKLGVGFYGPWSACWARHESEAWQGLGRQSWSGYALTTV